MEHPHAIMPMILRQLSALTLPALLLGGPMAIAQNSSDPALKLIKGGGTPALFGGQNQPLPTSSCPGVVSLGAGAVQPLRIAPAEVAGKNQLGCLSPNDAVYGADGCPIRLCGSDRGAVPLPAAKGPASPSQIQLPEP
jgi:hypothetical protein